MLKFLTTYLIVTGIGAMIALAAPSLVVLGLFLFILPGLILGLAPTAFLWGLIFTGGWLLARSVIGDNLATAIVAGVLTAAVLAAATIPNRLAGKAIYEAALIKDVTPPQPIKMRGDVRLDLPRPRWDNLNSRGKAGLRGFSCDNLCLALLFTPGVTSVTINKSRADGETGTGHDGAAGFDAEARTYRLVPKAQCPDGGVKPDLVGRTGLFPGKMEDGTALAAQWNLKLATEVCLVGGPPIGRHDLFIRETSSSGERVSRWSLLPGKPMREVIEIKDDVGNTLLRRFKLSVRVLSRLLHITPEGGIENFRFGWGTQTLSNLPKYSELGLLGVLEKHTDTVGKPVPADMLPSLRTQLRAALDDPALPEDAPAFELIGAYFDALSAPLETEDLDLVVRLARDDRIFSYDNLYKLKALPPEHATAIRNAFVERALKTSNPTRLGGGGGPSSFVQQLPDGSFAKLTDAEEQLLRTPARRLALPGLVARLHESGPQRAGQLVDLIREHAAALRSNHEAARDRRIKEWEKSSENERHISMMHAARTSLCVLGPKAAAAIEPLRAALRPETMWNVELEGHHGSDWNFVLARLGVPVGQLKNPPRLSGNDHSHRQRLREKLARFDPKRHC